MLSLRRVCLGLLGLPASLGCGGLVDFGPEGGPGTPSDGGPGTPPDFSWTRQFGSTGQDKASAVTFTRSGGVVLAGWTALGQESAGSLAKTNSFVRRYDRNGKVEWDLEFGTPDSDGVYAAVALDEDVVVAGYCRDALPGQTSLGEGDAFVTRFRNTGAIAWTQQFGTSGYDVAYAVQRAPSGELLVAGYVDGALPGFDGEGAEDAFWARFDPGGTLLSAAQFGGDKQDVAYSICGLTSGGVAIAGAAVSDLDGGVARGKEDAFVRVLGADGSLSFSRQFGGPSKDVATSIACLPNGAVAVAGYYYEELDGAPGLASYDAFLRKYDSAGNLVLSRVIGSEGTDYAFALATDGKGRFYVAGSTDGVVAGKAKIGRTDSFVVVLDADGNEIQSWQFGSPEFGEARAIAVSETGRFAAAGYSQGPLPGQLGSGAVDAYVTVLD